MEKAYQVTKIEEVYLYCDKCGAEMVEDKDAKNYLTSTPSDLSAPPKIEWLGIKYVCPTCGFSIQSKKRYPYQRCYFNKEG